MKKLLFFILILTTSCRYKHFEFDSVEHYHIKISENEISDIRFEANESGETNDLSVLLNEYSIPENIKLNEILSRFYKKTTLDEEKVSKIEAIYYDGLNTNIIRNKCIPFFRDVLIFKKSDSIVAVSKICFECDKQSTEDKNGISKEFDNWDYNDLQQILK